MAYTPHEWESGEVLTPAKLNTLTTAIGEMDMSYTPKTWHDGDILSAAEMNRIENAVASGGGGGGDISLATVTLSATAPQGYTVDWWCITGVKTPPFGEESTSIYQMQENPSETSNVFSVILYQGVAYIGALEFYDSVNDVGLWLPNPVLSANVTYDSDYGQFIVTGDCTIGGTLMVSG